MLLANNTIRTGPYAKVDIDTPYFRGEVEAQCLQDAIYDLVIMKISGARSPENPDKDWTLLTTVIAGTEIKPLNFAGDGKDLQFLPVNDFGTMEEHELETKNSFIIKEEESKINVINDRRFIGEAEDGRDVTPEVIEEVIGKEIPILSLRMISESFKVTPISMFSRQVCSSRKNTSIISLPESLKGSQECPSFVAPAITYAVEPSMDQKNMIDITHSILQKRGLEIIEEDKWKPP